MKRQPILITGSHRSGTTWLGHLLDASDTIGYIPELFNVRCPRPGLCSARFPHWYMHLTCEDGLPFVEPLARTLAFEFDYGDAARSVGAPRVFGRACVDAFERRSLRRSEKTPLLKDPIAFFSAEWLERTFGMRVIVTVRHPGAFAASLKRKSWSFDFNRFLEQPSLMRDHLDPYREDIACFAANQPDIVAQAGLLWRCVYGTAANLRDAHPDWLFVRHEDLSLNPATELGVICAALDIPLDERMLERVAETSGAHNPTDAPAHKTHELRRNSAANAGAWRQRLSVAEVTTLSNLVGSSYAEFYDEPLLEPRPAASR